MQLTMEQAARINPKKFYIIDWKEYTVHLSKGEFSSNEEARRRVRLPHRWGTIAGTSIIENLPLGKLRLEEKSNDK